MKASAGIFDASLGNRGNETSGKGILARQQQSNVTNMHFMDNLERAFRKGGEILADVMPKIYDTERIVRILGEDEAPKLVRINGEFEDKGGKKHYRVGGEDASKDHVIVTMGKAFSSKKMESFDMMTQVLQAQPGLINMIGDIFFRNSDLAGADQLADRFKKMLPPQLQDQPEGQPEIPQQVQQQMAKMQQDHEQLNAYAQQVEKELEQYKAGAQVKQMEIQSRESIERMKIEAQLTIAEITTKAQNERERMKLELDLNNKLRVQDDQQAHEGAMAAADANHEALMASMQHQHGMQAQEVAAQQAEATDTSAQ
jgi:hypothetical protein